MGKRIVIPGADFSSVCIGAPLVAQPVISPNGGYTPATVSITSATPSAVIYYTTDGSTPSAGNGTIYTQPISILNSCTLKAIAIKDGITSSISSAAFVEAGLAIVFNVTPNSAVDIRPTISINSSENDATVYYTTDGSTPTTASTQYTSAISPSHGNITIKAIAVKNGQVIATAEKSYIFYNKTDCTKTGYGVKASGSPLGEVSGWSHWAATNTFLTTGGYSKIYVCYGGSAGSFGVICYSSQSESSALANTGIVYKQDYHSALKTNLVSEGAGWLKFCYQNDNVNYGSDNYTDILLYD